MKRTSSTWLLSITLAVSLRGQDFTNLNFENANIVFAPPDYVLIATSNALPGWSAFLGTNELSFVAYNNYAVVATTGLVGSNSAVLDGHFSASITGNESISQTGLVPTGSESLLFDSTSSSLLVSLGGQSLSYTAISNALNSYGISYTIYAANISAFAGQTETLTFSLPSTQNGGLDDIKFSPEAIPEPSAISLVCLGSGVLLYLRHRKRSR